MFLQKKHLCIIFLLFFTFAFAQELPNGYAKIKLGMGVDEVKELLKKDSSFGYRGERDVTLLPGENRILIETNALLGYADSFLDRCWFQFYNDKLYIITINLNKEKIDHYSILTTLTKKYGTPNQLTPERTLWQSQKISMSLERPLSLKYIDKTTFEQLQAQINVQNATQEMTQQKFLEGL